MADITVVREEGSFRLIRDAEGRHAVVEARGGRVYSLDSRERADAEDTPEGMAGVVGADRWEDEESAVARFESMVRNERRFADKLR